MPNNERLLEFHTVASQGSISAAARELGLERATLSRRMSSLEEELGVRLMLRSTKSLVLTDAGQELNRRARYIVADTNEAWNAVKRMDETPRGTLKVSVAGGTLNDLIISFAKEFPEVKLEVVDTIRQVNLFAENIDIAVRFGPVNDNNLIVKKLNVGVDRLLVASPSYLEKNGVPKSPHSLSSHRCIVMLDSNGKPATKLSLRSGGKLNVAESFSANGMQLLRDACLAGLGIAFIPKPIATKFITSGELIPVLLDKVGDTAPVSIVFKDREYIEPKVRQFVDRAVPVLEGAYGN